MIINNLKGKLWKTAGLQLCDLMENEYYAQVQVTYRVQFVVFVLGIDIFDISHNMGI